MYEDTQVAGVIMPGAEEDEIGGIIVQDGDGDEAAMAGQDLQPCL